MSFIGQRQHGLPDRRQVVVVTGAAAGLGRAIARRFARPGSALGLLGRDADRLEAARDEAQRAGAEAMAIAVDVADAAAVERAAAAVEERFGAIDVWINNAMVSVFAPVHLTSAAEFRRVTEVTYLGVVHGTLSALARMRPRNRGVIVQVGSALAYRGVPLQAAYCAAKHTIQGFCDSLRCELHHDRIVRLSRCPRHLVRRTRWGTSPRRGRRGPAPARAGGRAVRLRRPPTRPAGGLRRIRRSSSARRWAPSRSPKAAICWRGMTARPSCCRHVG